MKRIERRTTAALIVVLGVAVAASADEVKGSFRHNATTVTPVDAIAYREDVEGKTVTLAVFTDFKIDRQAMLDAIVPWAGVFQQVSDRQGNVVVLRLISPTKCGAYVFLTAQSIGLSDDYPAHTKTTSAERAAGDCATASPQKMFDDTYEFKLSYDLPITPIPKATPLAAGGGEPGTAFLALVKAIRAKDARTAARYIPADQAPATPDANFVEGLALNYPKQAIVKEGLLKGDRARIEVQGTDREDKTIRGTIDMRKLQGSWRVTSMSMYFAE